MTTKQMIKQVIYDHLQKVREAVENELTNSDIQGVMEAESENIYSCYKLTDAYQDANKLALAVKERSDDQILLEQAEALYKITKQ